MSDLVKIQLHGELGEHVGETWQLAVKSVSEAVRAIDVLTKKKLSKFLTRKEKAQARYEVLINNAPFTSKNSDYKSIEEINQSELVIPLSTIKTIDIVPIIEGARGSEGTLGTILGVVLLIVAIATQQYWLVIPALGMIAIGVTSLLSKPPKFEDFRESDTKRRSSYLFSGPETTVGEGGPVPVGYGRLIIGSQIVAQSYKITDTDASTDIS